jgi:hypothetical protein
MRNPLAGLCTLAAICAAVSAHAEVAAGGSGEPQVLRSVAEDDQVRIEELRVRGQTKRLTVKPKIKGMDSYEITPPEPGRAPAEDPKAGQRVWWSFTF